MKLLFYRMSQKTYSSLNWYFERSIYTKIFQFGRRKLNFMFSVSFYQIWTFRLKVFLMKARLQEFNSLAKLGSKLFVFSQINISVWIIDSFIVKKNRSYLLSLGSNAHNHDAKLKSLATPGDSPGLAWLTKIKSIKVILRLARAYAQLTQNDSSKQTKLCQ